MSKFLNYAIGGGVAILATGVIAYSVADGNVAEVSPELLAEVESRNEAAQDWVAEQQAALDAQMAKIEQATAEEPAAEGDAMAEGAATEEPAAEGEATAEATEEPQSEGEAMAEGAATEEPATGAEATAEAEATEEPAAEGEATAEAEATEEPAAEGEASAEATEEPASEGEDMTETAEADAAPAESEEMASAGPDPELVAAGEKVFRQCQACHQVGDDAKNRVGPRLVNIVGGPIAAVEDFKYSNVLIEAGEGGGVWDREALTAFLANPRDAYPGTKMSFRGLNDEADIEAVIAYLQAEGGGGFDEANAGEMTAPEAETEEASAQPVAEPEVDAEEASTQPTDATATDTEEDMAQGDTAPATSTEVSPTPIAFEPTLSDGPFGLGRLATEDEIAAWNIDIRFDGQGLPQGSGSVADGEPIYQENCSVCHGTFGEAIGRWPVLSGGEGTLTADRPVKTIGSYWPYLATVYDYVHRAMPFGHAQSLTDDEVYAVTAYLLNLNFLVDDDFVLSNENFSEVAELPNQGEFYLDDRAETEIAQFVSAEVCMENCKNSVEITKRAAVLDVTPDTVD